ncbi:hypothetical protein MPL1032_20359 [Mesorhizobium plurifarium]|uniref:Uncharacterized protein n=1 Tax=Mesorhizobium plurifarium TaxID=69974 RepID=A0A0K2VWR5_MESPL|nr:hypothetical protein MPL1032_20359 [Mesorhizobium plurifarium]
MLGNRRAAIEVADADTRAVTRGPCSLSEGISGLLGIAGPFRSDALPVGESGSNPVPW